MSVVDRGPSVEDTSPIYALEAHHSLPQIDLRRSPLTTVIGVDSRQHRRFLRFMRLHYAKVGAMYRIGALLGIITLLVPRPIGLVLAVPTCLFTLPAWFLSLVTLSTDMMVISLRQFDFWYFTALNLMTWALLATMYWDLRVLSLVGALLGAQNIVFLDANFRTVTNSLKSCVVSVPAVLLVGIVAFFQHIDTDPGNFRSVFVSGVEVELADVCANAALTLALFVAHTAYAKRKLLLKKNRGLRVIRCVVFCAKLSLRPTSTRAPKSHHSRGSSVVRTSLRVLLYPFRNSTRVSQAPRLSNCIAQPSSTDIARLSKPVQPVALVPPKLQSINVYNTLAGLSLVDELSVRWRVFMVVSGVVGLVLTPLALLPHSADLSRFTAALAVSSLATTSASCLPVILSSQSDLMQALTRNFEFLFTSSEFSVAMLMVCDLMQWGWRTLPVLAWLLWFHTVLVLDAVTPPARRALRLRKVHTTPVVLLSIGGLVAIAYALLFTDSTLFVDRSLIRIAIAEDRHVELRTKSVLLNRMLTLVVWSLRLLWEVAWCAEDELVFIRGSLEYYTPLEMFPPVSEVPIMPLGVLLSPALRQVRRR